MGAEMDRLLEDYNYADTARIPNEKGFKTGDGLPWTSIAVGYVRKAAINDRTQFLFEHPGPNPPGKHTRAASVLASFCRQTIEN